MRKVYVVMRYIAYEGGDVTSVWGCESKANKKVKELQSGQHRDITYIAEEWEVSK